MTRSKYLKGPAGGSYPGRLVSVVVATTTPPNVPPTRTGTPRVFRSAHVCYTDRRHGRYSPAKAVTFGTPGEFWRWYESRGRGRSKVYTFSPVASDALVLLHGFDRFTRLGSRWVGKNPGGNVWTPGRGPVAGFAFKACILAGKPDIVEYVHDSGTYLWLSGHNYFRESEGHVARATGYEWRTRGDADDGPIFNATDPGDRAAMWLHAVVALAEWWGPLKAGGFPSTAPAGAWQFLRSRLPPKTLLPHIDPDALRLERLCCHGGRATTWFFGDIRPRGRHSPPPKIGPPPSGWPVMKGPIKLYDIRMTYPALLRDRDFPVKLSHYTSRMTVAELRDWTVNYHVLASVTLNTERPEYPYRRRGRVMYPVGRFTAHLSTPEIKLALDEGAIESVHCAAVYYKGRPYERAARELIDMRSAAEAGTRPGWAAFVKLVSNSMTGKLAPRKYQFEPAPGVTLAEKWGKELVLDADTGRCRCFVSRAGLVWERVEAEGGRGTTTAGYAVLQAYCRVRMRQLRERLPPRSVVSQGTDGIWVTSAAVGALDRIAESEGTEAGSLRPERSVSNARFLDSRHYWTDGVWTVAGLASPSFGAGTLSYVDHVRQNPVISSPPSAPVHVYEVERAAVLNCRPIDLIVGEDGWGQPVRLPAVPGQTAAPPDRPDDQIPW